MKINAKELVGENAISMQSGQNLYAKIAKPLLAGDEVEIDFFGVELFASPFFNASIGLLLRDTNIVQLQRRLRITNLEPVGKQLLNRVIANAIAYYENKGANASDDLQIILKNIDES